MTHHFTEGTGYFVRQPSWHRLERKVLADWPGSWQEAREEANLLWEPESTPLYVPIEHPLSGSNPTEFEQLVDWQRIRRSDTHRTLGVQTKKYRVIDNTAFGYVVESVLGHDLFDAPLKYEGVFELYGGAQVIALVYLDKPTVIPGDNSDTYTYGAFWTRHDGNGGLKCVLTNVRVVCANTQSMAEAGAKDEETSFVIRHASNWDERVAEVRDKLAAALMANEAYTEMATQMALTKVTPATMEKMVKRFLPVGDDMGPRQLQNRENEREVIRALIKGPTVSDDHRKTPYGFLMAATEWSDHYRRSQSASSYVSRQLTTKQPLKERAFAIAKQYAGVK